LWKVTEKTGSHEGGTGRNYEGLENSCPPTFNEASIYLKTNIKMFIIRCL